MHPILIKVRSYLAQANRGEASMPPEMIEKFKEMCGTALDKQFNSPPRKPTIRMSGIGQPLCKQQMAMAGNEEEAEYNLKMKFLFGDVIEAMAVVIMEAAGVNITSEQEGVTLDVGDVKLKGTLDVVIESNGEEAVYDVKSASPYAFDSKFSDFGGFHAIHEDDPFGYIAQGYGYAEAKGLPFGGWIAINKVNGEWAVAVPPLVDREYRAEALATIATNVEAIVSGAPFERCFTETAEIHPKMHPNKGEPTGNMLLPKECGWCGHKGLCWPSAEQLPKATSKAKSPPKTWYTKHTYDGPGGASR